jgi:hypothetical protein
LSTGTKTAFLKLPTWSKRFKKKLDIEDGEIDNPKAHRPGRAFSSKTKDKELLLDIQKTTDTCCLSFSFRHFWIHNCTVFQLFLDFPYKTPANLGLPCNLVETWKLRVNLISVFLVEPCNPHFVT